MGPGEGGAGSGETAQLKQPGPAHPLCLPPAAGTATLPDGRVLIVGGVKRNGRSGWPWDNAEGRASNNPTYAVFNPATK